MLILILVSAVATPYQIAFMDEDSTSLVGINYFVDIIFTIDVCLNFYIAYYDETHELITERKKITTNYLKSWFIYDILSILPLLRMFPALGSQEWLKFLRIVRVLRIVKVVKENPTMSKLFNEKLKLNPGVERLVFFLIMVLMFTHFMACLWFFQAKF